MKLIKLDLELPTIFNDIEQRLGSIFKSNQFSIAGGSISDHYMGYDFNDIDVFIETSKKKKEDLLKQLDEQFDSVTYLETDDPSYQTFANEGEIYKAKAKGFSVDLIFVRNLKRVLDFDFIFRQFYLYQGVVYTTQNALDDIEQKKLRLQNPKSKLSSLSRFYYFRDRYGFTIDPRSLDYLKWYLNKDSTSFDSAVDYINNSAKLNHQQKKEIISSFNSNHNFGALYSLHFNVEQLPFHPVLCNYIDNYLHEDGGFNVRDKVGLIGNYYDKIVNYKPSFKPITFTVTIDLDQTLPYYQRLFKLFYRESNKYRLKMIANGNQPMIDFFETLNRDTFTKRDLFDVFEHYHYFSDYFETFAPLEFEGEHYSLNHFLGKRLNNMHAKTPTGIYKITISESQQLDDSKVLLELLHERLLKLSIHNIDHDEMYQATLIKTTKGKYTLLKTEQSNNLNNLMFLDIIQDLIEKKYPTLFEKATNETSVMLHPYSNPKSIYFKSNQINENNNKQSLFDFPQDIEVKAKNLFHY